MALKPEKPPRAPAYEAPAVQKAFELLAMVADSAEGLGVSELSTALGYSKGTIHGIVQALLKAGVLDQSPQRKKLFLGPAIVELAFKSRSYRRTIQLAQPLLDHLRDRVGQTVFLGMLSRSRVMIIAAAEASNPLKISSPPGTSLPVLAGALGKMFLSQFDDKKALQLISRYGLTRYTQKSITDGQAYLKELARVRREGYAVDDEEYLPGVRAVAFSLGNHRGLSLALWAVGFAGSMDRQAMPGIVREVLETAEKLKASLHNGH
jgi:DNA-binding IclR family transcriptional regulator